MIINHYEMFVMIIIMIWDDTYGNHLPTGTCVAFPGAGECVILVEITRPTIQGEQTHQKVILLHNNFIIIDTHVTCDMTIGLVTTLSGSHHLEL